MSQTEQIEQGIYLFAKCLNNEDEIQTRFEAFFKDNRVDAFLIEPLSYDKKALKSLIENIQKKDIAVLIKEDIELAISTQADGVELRYVRGLKPIRKRLEHFSLGVVCSSKDEAMKAGELEVDYIAFCGKEAAVLTKWWMELFTIPCVDKGFEDSSIEADFKFLDLMP